MKKILCLLYGFSLMIQPACAQDCSLPIPLPKVPPQNVPFQNVTLNPNQSLAIAYSFGLQLNIFCFNTITTNQGLIFWPYKGSTHCSNIPSVLKTKAQIEGFFADPSGTIIIKNNVSKPLVIGCVFGF